MNPKKIVDNLNEVDVIILCGGLGKRFRSVSSKRPKILAKIGNITLLDILINNISSYGTKNIILCVGYLKDQIKRYCYDNYYNNHIHNRDYNIKFSDEYNCLGTGGAIKNAKSLIINNPFIVMNGDSICNIDFKEFLDFHTKKKSSFIHSSSKI